MLVLSRKLGEKVVIDGNIVVQIVDVQGDKVRIGIEAPKEVPVHREEVFRRMDDSHRTPGLRSATAVPSWRD